MYLAAVYLAAVYLAAVYLAAGKTMMGVKKFQCLHSQVMQER